MYSIYGCLDLSHVNDNHLTIGFRTIVGFLVIMFSIFICAVVLCDDPGKPANGAQLVNKGFVYGGSVTFTCNKDFTLRGTPTIYCQENKQWTASVPQCLGKCVRTSLEIKIIIIIIIIIIISKGKGQNPHQIVKGICG